jgi:hypothetical protein
VIQEGQTPPGTYPIKVTGSNPSVPSPSIPTATVTVVAVSEAITVSVAWLSNVSLTTNAGVQTWTVTIANHATTTQYVLAVISGGTSTGSRPFLEQSTTVAIAPAATVTITVTHKFTSADLGPSYHFQAIAFFGSTPSNLNNVSKNLTTGNFAVVA